MIGWLVTRPRIRDWIISTAMKTPDDPIYAADGSGRVYMNRYWLFNPLTKKDNGDWKRKWPIPFSIRVHNIVLPDDDRHLHDHPFNARTWIMVGGYDEVRAEESSDFYGHRPAEYPDRYVDIRDYYDNDRYVGVMYERREGDSTALTFERYHKITRIHHHDHPVGAGAWTLFAFGDYLGAWGFLVNEVKVAHKEYIEKFKRPAMEPDYSHCDLIPKGFGQRCLRCHKGDTLADGTIDCGEPRVKRKIQ